MYVCTYTGGGSRISFSLKRDDPVCRFYVCLYSDEHASNLISVFQVLVYFHEGIPLNAVVGKLEEGMLHVPEHLVMHSRAVEIISSANELIPNSPAFALQANQPAPPIDFRLRASTDGARDILIHMVDSASRDLLHSWLISMVARFPHCDVIYNTIKVQAGTGNRKSLEWKNKYNKPKKFHFDSSDSSRVQLLDEELELGPFKAGRVHIFLHPSDQTEQRNVFIFVHDENGYYQECVMLPLKYIHT